MEFGLYYFLDETDMKELEKAVRTIVMDGLLWGVSKLVPVGYGIMKLQIATVVEDEKVSIDDLVEKIQEFEDFVRLRYLCILAIEWTNELQ